MRLELPWLPEKVGIPVGTTVDRTTTTPEAGVVAGEMAITRIIRTLRSTMPLVEEAATEGTDSLIQVLVIRVVNNLAFLVTPF